MQIIPITKEHYPGMAALFVENFKRLRRQHPALPDLMENPQSVIEKFEHLTGLAAVDKDDVLAYIGWFWVDEFRGTPRKGAYCPEWGHGALEQRKPELYRALYRKAAALWTDAGCGVHALTLLAHDHEAEKAWFWNGFGLTGVDAIRPMTPLEVQASANIRKATHDDLDALNAIEAEHASHYRQPPILMSAYDPHDMAEFLNEPSSVWIATEGGTVLGFLRFQHNSFGAAAIVNAPDKIAITGAFVRPQHRGKRIAAALLDAALDSYRGQGFNRCSVDFESFNPDATAFWLQYFDPVCLSVTRIPESLP